MGNSEGVVFTEMPMTETKQKKQAFVLLDESSKRIEKDKVKNY